MFLEETRCENVDWIQMAKDTDQWRASVNTAMDLRVQ